MCGGDINMCSPTEECENINKDCFEPDEMIFSISARKKYMNKKLYRIKLIKC
jgi:hypothetical protein